MVSTRVIIGLSGLILLLGFGFPWLAFKSNSMGYGYTTFEIGSMLGSLYGPCKCPPSNSSIDGQFWLLVVPILAAPGALSTAAITYPISFVLAAVALFRWKLMVVSGLLALLSGVLWLGGVSMVEGQIVKGLESWYGAGAGNISISVWAPVGPYAAIFGGIIMITGYVLSKKEVLDYPTD